MAKVLWTVLVDEDLANELHGMVPRDTIQWATKIEVPMLTFICWKNLGLNMAYNIAKLVSPAGYPDLKVKKKPNPEKSHYAAWHGVGGE